MFGKYILIKGFMIKLFYGNIEYEELRISIMILYALD